MGRRRRQKEKETRKRNNRDKVVVDFTGATARPVKSRSRNQVNSDDKVSPGRKVPLLFSSRCASSGREEEEGHRRGVRGCTVYFRSRGGSTGQTNGGAR